MGPRGRGSRTKDKGRRPRVGEHKHPFLKTSQYWSLFLIKLQAFFYRTPAVAASGFSRQQILSSAKFSIYC